MGEYATRKSDGEQVKIGTCEDLYYLRADQAGQVEARDSSETDPIRFAAELRFRFPFPDEDGTAPGAFSDPFRSIPVYVDPSGIPSFDHRSVQFTANYPRAGYLLSIPCPEGPDALTTLNVQKNGWRGGTARIVQQRVRNGQLVLIAACPGCDAKYRLETLEMAEPYIMAVRAEADEIALRDDPNDGKIAFWHKVADRIVMGYTNPPAWVRSLAAV